MRNETKNRTKGTVLVMVVVLVALLGIMASMFVLNTRITLRAVQNQVGGTANQGQVNQKEVEISTDSVIAQIQSTLAEDLWGRPENLTDTTTPADRMNKLRLLNLPSNSNDLTYDPRPTSAQYARFDTVAFSTGGNHYFLNEPWDAPVRFLPPATNLSSSFSYYNAGWQNTIDPATGNPLTYVDGDPWLASMGPNGGVWPQGSDLFLVKFTNAGNDYWPMFGAVSIFQNIPYELVTAPTQNWYPETYADADGDGFFDSVWLYQKGFFNEITNAAHITYADGDVDDPNPSSPTLAYYNGLVADLPIKSTNPAQAYRMAVRIVDTSGMVNVNTAWQVPSDLPAASNSVDQLNQFLGNVASGVNLYGCTGSSTTAYTYSDSLAYSGTTLPGKAQIPTFQDLLYLQNSYILRTENPDWAQLKSLSSKTLNSTKELAKFSPLDSSDEMELRYRWYSPGIGYVSESLDPGNRSTLETYFPELDGGTASGKIPDSNSDKKFTTSDTNYAAVMANIQKRTLLTAYSFSRNIRTTPMSDTEIVKDFDGRMKNLDKVIYALVYRIKSNVFPGATPAEIATNQTRVQEFVQIIYHAFLADTDQAHYADVPPTSQTVLNATQLQNYAEYHTWQYIANLVDYLDDDDVPTVLNTNDANLQLELGGQEEDKTKPLTKPPTMKKVLAAVNDITFGSDYKVIGLEKHAVISEVIVRCEQYIPADTTTTGEPGDTVSGAQGIYSVYVEQYNLWNEPVARAKRVGVYYISDESGKANKMNAIVGMGLFTPSVLTDIPANDWINLNRSASSNTPFNDGNSTDYINISDAIADSASATGYSESSYNVKLVIVTYQDAAGTIPEDVFVTTTALPITTGDSAAVSFQRNYASTTTLSPWATMVNDSTTNLTVSTGTGNLGLANTANTSLICLGYATVTTANTATRRLADVWCDPAIADLWHIPPTGATWGNFAKIRNWGDLLAVPYVGYCRDANGEYKGIGDWLSQTDNTLRFDLTETHLPTDTYYKKGYTLREGLLNRYTILNREDDGDDQLGGGTADTKDEMRLPGLININTASTQVLSALHPLASTASGTINTVTNKPYKSTNHFLTTVGMPVTADINILNLSSTTAAQDVLQQQGLFTRIANLITTRSDTFVAYVYVQSLDKDGKVIASRREIVLFDRSLCNQPPLIAKFDDNGTPADTTDDVFTNWAPNPAYRPVKVVARQVVN